MTKYRITYQRARIEETEVEVEAKDADDAISKANAELKKYKQSDWCFAEDEGVGPGVTPEVIRKHYEKLDSMAIAKRNTQKRLAMADPTAPILARLLRAEENVALDSGQMLSQTGIA